MLFFSNCGCSVRTYACTLDAFKFNSFPLSELFQLCVFSVLLFSVTVSNFLEHYLGLLSLCKVLGDTLYAGCFIKLNLLALYYTADTLVSVNLILDRSVLPSFLPIPLLPYLFNPDISQKRGIAVIQLF